MIAVSVRSAGARVERCVCARAPGKSWGRQEVGGKGRKGGSVLGAVGDATR